MAARLKKRLPKIKDKIINVENLELKDIICTICQSILIEPVSLPCYHNFCKSCFNGSVENNALCCPLCRSRIGSWLRTTTKQNNLVNRHLWNFIKNKFSKEIDEKFKGEDVDLPTETILPRISEPGEIRLEYEAEMKRLRDERLRLEEKQIFESTILIRKLHQEEVEAHKKYLEKLKQDELLAKQIQQEQENLNVPHTNTVNYNNSRDVISKPKIKAMTIDNYLSKSGASCTVTTNLQTTNENNKNKISTQISYSSVSPEILPKSSNINKHNVEKNNRTETHIWNKENGAKLQVEQNSKKKKYNVQNNDIKSKTVHSLLVSLPLPQNKLLHCNKIKNKTDETDNTNLMVHEFCYFKPIEGNSPTSIPENKDLPLRVPSVRPDREDNISPSSVAPSRDQYLEELYNLRKLSFAHKLPSAFVIAPNILRSQEQNVSKAIMKAKVKKSPGGVSNFVENDSVNMRTDTCIRRTRSMGCITRDNDITPKKRPREMKACSDKKLYLRSDGKRIRGKKTSCSPVVIDEAINNNKVNLAVKNLSSPLESCDVQDILEEQLKIEMIIEQEKSDLELARRMDAELNGRRQLRAASKRQSTLNHTLRPTKKLKV